MSEKERQQAPLLPSTGAASPLIGTKWTVQDVLCYIGNGRFQSFLYFILGFAYMADAAEVLLLSFVGPDVKCEWNLTGIQESLLSVVVFVGMAIGSYTFGAVGDLWGRKPTMLTNVTLTVTSGILSAGSPGYYWLLVFRFLTGIGLGGFILMMSMFSEFLPIQKRGSMISGYQFFWALGAVLEALIAWLVMPHFHWRGLVVATTIPLLLLLFILPFVPESPRYLVTKGQEESAIEILQLIAKWNGKSLPPDMQLHVQEADRDEEKSSVSCRFFGQVKTLFTYPLSRITPVLWLNWVSIAFAYYSVVILTTSIQASDEERADCVEGNVEFSGSSFRDILISAAAELPGTLFVVLTIDFFGRKRLVTGCWMVLATAVLCLPITSSLRSFFLVIARFFAVSNFVSLLVFAPEIYPSSCRSFAVGMGNLVSRIGGAMSPFVSQAMFDAYGLTFICVLQGSLFLAIGASALLIPVETGGRRMNDTLEDMAEEFNKPAQSQAVSEEADP